MKTIFHNKRIAGILGILPESAYLFEDEMRDGTSVRNQKIKKNMGYGKRYRAKKNTTISKLCIRGLRHLLDKDYIKKEEIGAILVTSCSPDYYVPQISNLIQGELGLSTDVFAVDYWAGCSGYIKGLLQSFMLLEALDRNKKVLLFVGDTLNQKQSENEIFDSPPFGGDAASITIIENTEECCDIPFMMQTDGEAGDLAAYTWGVFADMYHTGRCAERVPSTNEIFRFYQQCIPAFMLELSEYAHKSCDEIEHFFFIQANELSVRKFADKLGIDRDKVSMNLVEKYGDLSAALNPISIIDYYGEKLLGKDKHLVAICGYGLGAEWGGTFITLGNLICCEMLNTNL